MSSSPTFRESHFTSSAIRDLGLKIAGTRLEPIITKFESELREKGIVRLTPACYLSTEWGVPFGTISIGIPFYLARPELVDLHGEEVGHVEGMSEKDILRYLRHEMGHVVNYAYKLYEHEEWVKLFGAITQPYLEDYRPQPFSRRFVRHLPGWYAQKHPDEDWSETFAVWMAPQRDWRKEYKDWPAALKKLEFCERTMARLNVLDPTITLSELDENVSELDYTVQQYYKKFYSDETASASGLDGALRAIFEDLVFDDLTSQEGKNAAIPAGKLLQKIQRNVMADVFRWTGHFPERTRGLMRQLAERANELKQVYYPAHEIEATIAITTFITSLAMNYVQTGNYFPDLHQEPSKNASASIPSPGP